MKNNKERLYIAYGSNLNLRQMAHGCPTAEVVGKSLLRGWRLMFRGGSPQCGRYGGTDAGTCGAGAYLAAAAQ